MDYLKNLVEVLWENEYRDVDGNLYHVPSVFIFPPMFVQIMRILSLYG